MVMAGPPFRLARPVVGTAPTGQYITARVQK